MAKTVVWHCFAILMTVILFFAERDTENRYVVIQAASIDKEEYTLEYEYNGERNSISLSPFSQKRREVLMKRLGRKVTTIKFTAYYTKTRRPASVNGLSSFTHQGTTFRSRLLLLVGPPGTNYNFRHRFLLHHIFYNGR